MVRTSFPAPRLAHISTSFSRASKPALDQIGPAAALCWRRSSRLSGSSTMCKAFPAPACGLRIRSVHLACWRMASKLVVSTGVWLTTFRSCLCDQTSCSSGAMLKSPTKMDGCGAGLPRPRAFPRRISACGRTSDLSPGPARPPRRGHRNYGPAASPSSSFTSTDTCRASSISQNLRFSTISMGWRERMATP